MREAKFSNCLSVARLHKEYLDKSFLGSLGERFVTLLYKSLLKSNSGVLIIAKDKGKVVGFVSGIESAGEFHKYFLKNDFLKAFFPIAGNGQTDGHLENIRGFLLSPQKDIQLNLPRAELLSIGVKRRMSGERGR